MTVNKSISLSYAEVDKINDLSDVVSPSWSVGDITPKKNKEGEVIGYNGTVYTTDSRGNKINTKISVSSGVGKDGKKTTSGCLKITKMDSNNSKYVLKKNFIYNTVFNNIVYVCVDLYDICYCNR